LIARSRREARERRGEDELEQDGNACISSSATASRLRGSGTLATCGERPKPTTTTTSRSTFAGPCSGLRIRSILARSRCRPDGAHLDMLHETPSAWGFAPRHRERLFRLQRTDSVRSSLRLRKAHVVGGEDHSDGQLSRLRPGAAISRGSGPAGGAEPHAESVRQEPRIRARDIRRRRARRQSVDRPRDSVKAERLHAANTIPARLEADQQVGSLPPQGAGRDTRRMNTNVELAPLLVVRGAAHAIDFYVRALGAEVLSATNTERSGASVTPIYASPALRSRSPRRRVRGTATHRPRSEGRRSCCNFTANVRALVASMCDAGATVVFPVQELLGERMARVRDPFGHLWLLREQLEVLSTDEIQRQRDEALRAGLAAPAFPPRRPHTPKLHQARRSPGLGASAKESFRSGRLRRGTSGPHGSNSLGHWSRGSGANPRMPSPSLESTARFASPWTSG